MEYYLAQVIAKMVAPINDPVMAEFVTNHDRINSLAESSEGDKPFAFSFRTKFSAEEAIAFRHTADES